MAVGEGGEGVDRGAAAQGALAVAVSPGLGSREPGAHRPPFPWPGGRRKDCNVKPDVRIQQELGTILTRHELTCRYSAVDILHSSGGLVEASRHSRRCMRTASPEEKLHI
jgi:hypothetical protein